MDKLYYCTVQTHEIKCIKKTHYILFVSGAQIEAVCVFRLIYQVLPTELYDALLQQRGCCIKT